MQFIGVLETLELKLFCRKRTIFRTIHVSLWEKFKATKICTERGKQNKTTNGNF
jgi:hypothetical protein